MCGILGGNYNNWHCQDALDSMVHHDKFKSILKSYISGGGRLQRNKLKGFTYNNIKKFHLYCKIINRKYKNNILEKVFHVLYLVY